MIELSQEELDMIDQLVEDAHSEDSTKIPENSKSLLIDEKTSRFNGAIWYNEIQNKTIVLAGIGGIGSYCAFLLARMRPKNIYIYDPDVVETANLSGQLYGMKHIGMGKVYAMQNIINNFADYYSVYASRSHYTEENEASDIMICGFDNMLARKTFFNKWLKHVNNKLPGERKDCLYIDGRLAAEEFQILCITGNDEYNINRYQKEFLFSDAEADTTICSYKQTTFCANMIASYMINLFVNFVANTLDDTDKPVINRDLPFYTKYSAETMYFKTEA